MNIGKNAGLVGLQSALIVTGYDLVAKTVKGEQINGDETIELSSPKLPYSYVNGKSIPESTRSKYGNAP